MLVEYIIKRFQHNNETKAQLIFTTHSVDIMNREMLRRDQYYLVDKNSETGVSELYSISDFSVRNDEKLGKLIFWESMVQCPISGRNSYGTEK